MDLGTVKKKLKNKEYPTLYKCNEDVRLVWSNCMTYNADGSDFFKLAESLQKKWDIQFNKVLTDIGISNTSSASAMGSDSVNKVSLQEKRNFAKMLYQITKEDLGKLLVDVEHKCPAALKRNAAEDEIELNVDAIPPSVMQELNAFLQTYVFFCHCELDVLLSCAANSSLRAVHGHSLTVMYSRALKFVFAG
jgi:Bromodomain/Bromodomain extra-terminal - transcription regulation